MISLKNNKLFQACIPLALVLTFFCTPVFSLNSLIDKSYYDVDLSSTFNDHLVEYCFDGDSTTTCASNYNSDGTSSGILSIIFDDPVNVSSFEITLGDARLYSHIMVDGVYYPYDSGAYSFDNATYIAVISTNTDLLHFKEVSFIFEVVAPIAPIAPVAPVDNDITQGINWSLFAYSFTVVTFFSMLGRGVKSVIDLVRYG